MHILMTGATGFIGRAAVLRLQRDGHTVSAWTRSAERARSRLGAGVRIIAASEGDAGLERAVDDADVIVNLAGEPILGGRWTRKRRRALIDSRVHLTERLVAAVRTARRPPRALISASAVGFYGHRPGEALDEQSVLGEGFAAELCRAWEAAAMRAESGDTRVALLRIGIVLGAGGGALATALPAFRAGLGGPLGNGEQVFPWIHLDDMAEIIACAVSDERLSGPINCAAPDRANQRELARCIGRVLRRPAVVPVPASALKLALGDAADVLLASQQVVPRALQARGYQFRFTDLQAAVRDVLQPVDSCIIEPIEGRAAGVPIGPYLAARRPRYVLDQTTEIDAPLAEVFGFFSQAENLAAITPPSMSFHILTPTPIAMGAGATIDYRIKIGPAPMKWRTVIEAWEPGVRFVDAQHRGPYRAWWHEHHFQAVGERTIMRDLVYYAPPLGVLGRIANRLFIDRMLRQIFDYRSAAIRLRFGAASDAERRAA